MTALAKDRDTRAKSGKVYQGPPAPGVTIFRGSLVVLNASAQLQPGTTATGLTAIGRAETGTADNPLSVRVGRGECFAFGNSASADAVAPADYGKPVYIVDDQTVAKTDGSGTRSKAGTCRGVDEFGVWVEF